MMGLSARAVSALAHTGGGALPLAGALLALPGLVTRAHAAPLAPASAPSANYWLAFAALAAFAVALLLALRARGLKRRAETAENRCRKTNVRLMQRHDASQTLLDAHGGPALLLDPDGVILAANTAAAEALKTPRTLLPGENLRNFVPWEQFEAFVHATQAALCDQTPSRFQAELPSWGGDHLAIPIPGRGAPKAAILPDHGGSDESFRDVKESEELHRSISELTPDALVIQQDELFVFANRAALDMLGAREPSQVVGKNVADFIHPDSISMAREQKRLAEAKIKSPSAEIRLLRADGATRLAEIRAAAILYKDKPAILTVARDITERRKEEDELRASRVRYDALYEQASEGIILADRRGRIIDANPHALNMLSLAREELMGKHPRHFIHPDDQSFLPDVISRLAAGETVRIETRLRLPGGDYMVAAVSARAINDLLQFMLHDITDHKRLESELTKAKAAAEDANRAKGEFLASMSHEIRTPISGILGMIELVLQSSTGRQREYLEMTKRSAEALLTIINDILDFSKIEARKIELAPVDFDLPATMKRALETFRVEAQKKSLELSLAIDPQTPRLLFGDPDRLAQVVRNLLGNAVKFTEQGSVALKVELLAAEEDEPLLKFSVADTGPGIDPKDQSRLFKSFSQLGNPATRKATGTGLGLAISSRLVRLMGGAISVTSEPGVGSTFSFTCRFSKATGKPRSDHPPHGQDATSASELPALNILLAEDNEINQLFISQFLREAGHTVSLAMDGLQALDAMRQNSFDLVLMDVQMPRMDGVEATRKIRSLDPSVHDPLVPVIALTAFVMKGDKERFLTEGMDDYVSKPVDIAELFDVIARTVKKKGPPAIPADKAANNGAVAREVDNHLKRFLGRDEFLRQITGMFMEKGDTWKQTLAKAVKEGDLENLASIAHTMVNSGVAIGSQRLVDLCKKLEKAARNNDLPTATRVYPKVTKTLETILQYLREAQL